MKLMDALHRMSFRSLLSMARDYNLDDSVRSKTELLLMIRKYLLRDDLLDTWIQRLSIKQLFLLRVISSLIRSSKMNYDVTAIQSYLEVTEEDNLLKTAMRYGLFLSLCYKPTDAPTLVSIDENAVIFDKISVKILGESLTVDKIKDDSFTSASPFVVL